MSYNVDPFPHTTTEGTVTRDGDLNVTVQAIRNLHIESNIRTGCGKNIHVDWTQALNYVNRQTYRDKGTIQVGPQYISISFYKL